MCWPRLVGVPAGGGLSLFERGALVDRCPLELVLVLALGVIDRDWDPVDRDLVFFLFLIGQFLVSCLPLPHSRHR